MKETDKYAELYKNRNRIKIKKKYILIFILIVAALTNPSITKHQTAAVDKIQNYLQNSPHTSTSSAGSLYFVEDQIKSRVSSSSYLFFSTTEVTIDNKAEIIGIGLFGMVFISDAVDFYLNKYLK